MVCRAIFGRDIEMQQRQIIRYVLNGIGAILVLAFFAGGGAGGWSLALGLLAMFLGVTDFGRQCPLILSMRHLAYRLRSKGKIPVVSAKPIEETVTVDRENSIS
jgi:hypothetical protein